MPVGSISRDLIEKLFSDTRRLFRAPVGMSSLSCMIGIISMRSGVGIVSPLRIRTAQGTIAGQGIVDLNRQQLDMTVGSQSATTSAFALDVPFRISGAFSNPIVSPSTNKVALATANLSELPPSLRQVAQHNPCTSPRQSPRALDTSRDHGAN
jgi:AsmA family protein